MSIGPAEIVVIGVSLGGSRALPTLLAMLPPALLVPLVIVQHLRAGSTEGVAQLLQQRTHRPIDVIEDKTPLAAGRVYVAPADYHVVVDCGALALTTDAPVRHARPSIDVLFESAAAAYGAAVVAVVLTGTNDDGARGAAAIRRRGGRVIVEDPATAERGELPAAVLAATEVDAVLPLEHIAARVVTFCECGQA